MTSDTDHPASAGVDRKPAASSQHQESHGSLAAWVGVSISFIGIVVGGLAMVPPLGAPVNWPIFAIGAALFCLGGLVGLILNKLGYGRG